MYSVTSDGNIEQVKVFIEQGADVNYHNPDMVSSQLSWCKIRLDDTVKQYFRWILYCDISAFFDFQQK